jgi:anti-sigma B factor antagonist
MKVAEGALRITRRSLGDVAVLELRGRLEGSLERALVREIQGVIDRGGRRVVLDCGGLEFLSSRGVSAFLAVLEDLRAGGGDLKLAWVKPQAAVVLDRLGVSRLIQRFDTAEAAAEAFRIPIAEFLSQGGLDVFVSSPAGRVFHASGCASVRRIGTAVTYPSKKQARDAGLAPCRRCIRD